MHTVPQPGWDFVTRTYHRYFCPDVNKFKKASDVPDGEAEATEAETSEAKGSEANEVEEAMEVAEAKEAETAETNGSKS